MIVGIDPGKSGGMACLDDDGKFLGGIRMPILRHGKRDVIYTPFLTDAVSNSLTRPTVIVIEQVSAMPGQGVTSMFNFGRHMGAIEGWALGWGCAVHWVTPAKWKKHFNLSKEKKASLDCARLRFGEDDRWLVKANDGIAEAALIALWYVEKKV